jgi:hypothetical protein
MSQPIKIIVTAETAEAAAALRNFTQQAGSGLKTMSETAATTAAGLRQMRESAMLLHESFIPLETGIYLLGGQRFPQLASAVLGVRAAVMGLRTVMKLTEMSFQELFLPLLAVSSAVAAGFALWDTYGGSLETTEQKAKKLSDTLAKLPKLLEDIADLNKRGIVSDTEQAKYQSFIAGKTPLYYSETETYTDAEGKTRPSLTEQSTRYIRSTGRGFTGYRPLKQANLSDVTSFVDYLQDQERLGNAQQIAAQDVANQQAKSAKPEEKMDEQAVRRQVEQERQIREDGLKQFESDNKQLELEITNQALTSGKDRQELWQQEYQRRIVLAQQAVFSGQIDEKTYKTAVLEAQNAMLEGQKKYNEELAKEAALRQEIARGNIEGNIRGIKSQPFLTREEKQGQLLPQYTELYGLNQGRINDLQSTVNNPDTTDIARLDAQKELVQLKQQQADLENQIFIAEQQSGNFAQRWNFNWQTHLTQLKDQWGDLATTLSSGAFKTIEQGVQGISNALAGMIFHSKNAGQAFLQLGENLLTSFISTILEAVIMAEIAIPILTTLGVLSGGATAEQGAAVTSAALLSARSVAMAGMFAEGGRPTPGQLAIIGERGPELWVPDSSGTIISNDKMNSMLGGSGSTVTGIAGGGEPKVEIAHVTVKDDQALQAFLKSSTAKHIIVSHLTDPATKTKIGIQT